MIDFILKLCDSSWSHDIDQVEKLSHSDMARQNCDGSMYDDVKYKTLHICVLYNTELGEYAQDFFGG